MAFQILSSDVFVAPPRLPAAGLPGGGSLVPAASEWAASDDWVALKLPVFAVDGVDWRRQPRVLHVHEDRAVTVCEFRGLGSRNGSGWLWLWLWLCRRRAPASPVEALGAERRAGVRLRERVASTRGSMTAKRPAIVETSAWPAPVLAPPLGPMAGRFLMLALPLAATTVPRSPDRGSPQLTGPLRTHPRAQLPNSNPLSAKKMMWIKEFKDLNELKEFLISQLNYDEQSGFSFVGITSGLEFKEVADSLGEPDSMSTESEQQQTLLYNAWVDHETEGKRDHHKLNVLFWFFHKKPLEAIRIHFDYYKTGEFAAAFHQFIRELFTSMMDKFGKPEKKSLRKAKEEITYVRGKHTLWMWSNTEGLRIQIK